MDHFGVFSDDAVTDCFCPLGQDHDIEETGGDWQEPDTIAEYRGEH